MQVEKTDLEVKLKTFELSEEVRERLTREPHGNQRLIAENLFRYYYGMEPVNLDKIKDSKFGDR